MRASGALVAVVSAVAIGFATACMMVPDRYKEPIERAHTASPKTVAVEGFSVGGFQTTGYTTSTNMGTGSALGPGGVATGSYVDSGVAVHDEYIVSSAAEDFRSLLAQTGCFRVVAPGAGSDLLLVGRVQADAANGWLTVVQLLEGLTITPLFGMPFPARLGGSAEVNIYDESTRQLIGSVSTGPVYLTGWTTLYTAKQDGGQGRAVVRAMAMRDLADRIAKDACSRR
jgi:hypothetical protein